MAKKKQIGPFEEAIPKRKSTVKLVSYTLRATINTGPYENLSPEVTVEAESLQEAHEVAMNHIAGLFRKYSINAPIVKDVAIDTTNTVVDTVDQGASTGQFSDHYMKIHGAINSTNNKELLMTWRPKVADSKKLIAAEKRDLTNFIDSKLK